MYEICCLKNNYLKLFSTDIFSDFFNSLTTSSLKTIPLKTCSFKTIPLTTSSVLVTFELVDISILNVVLG